MKTFLTTHRIFTCSMAMILLTHTIHAYAPTTTLATGAQVTTLGSAALATNAQAVDIQGSDAYIYTDTLDSLAAISRNVTRVPLATSAQAVAIEGDSTGTAIVGGTSMTASTNDLSSISRGLSGIEGPGFAIASDSLGALAGTGNTAGAADATHSGSTNTFNPLTNSLADICGASFATTTDSLHIIAGVLAAIEKQSALTQVISAASNTALTCAVIGATNAAAFNSAMNTVFTNLATAQATPSNANIATVQSDITTALAVDLTAGTITTPYAYQVITAALNQLNTAVANWLFFYPA